jgi:hypothetical protein
MFCVVAENFSHIAISAIIVTYAVTLRAAGRPDMPWKIR